MAGRQEDIELTAGAVCGAPQGRGVIVGGAAGVGKTRVCAETIDIARRLGHRCHQLTATSSTLQIPMAVFAEIGHAPGTDPLREIQETLSRLTSHDPHHSAIVAVDDAHLLDDQSAFVIHQLVVRKLANVICSVRTGERAPDAIAALWKDQYLIRLELQPLSLNDIGVLLQAALDYPVESTSLRRLQTMSGGNPLLLRHLVDDELATGHLHVESGLWFWAGGFTVTPSLADVVRKRIAAVPRAVGDLLDLLTISEPLTTTELGDLVDNDTLELAEALGMITTATTATNALTVRLSHPLFGEVRRADLASDKQRHLTNRIADALTSSNCAESSVNLRRTVLTLESHHADPDLLAAATRAALKSLDITLATQCATAALAQVSSPTQAYPHVLALVVAGQGQLAETTLEAANVRPGDPIHPRWTALRAANLIWMLARPTTAADLVDIVSDTDLMPLANAELLTVRACVLAIQGRPLAAIPLAESALDVDDLSAFFALMATAALVMSAGAVGDLDKAGAHATRGYARVADSWQTAHLQFWLAAIQARVYRVSGELEKCSEEAAAFTEIARDVQGALQIQATFLRGHAALAGGRLRTAGAELLDSLVGNTSGPSNSTGLNPACLIWLAEAQAVSGNPSQARQTLLRFSDIRPVEHSFMDSGAQLAEAWCNAIEGRLDHAIDTVVAAAEAARLRGQFAYEVIALQMATQFGYTLAASRLAELAAIVGGPRAAIAADHADAVGANDGHRLLAASRDYQTMGDLVAAADAAAQAATAYNASQNRGRALVASGTARRLAAEAGCGATPALRSITPAAPFTLRQHEVIQLVATGMSNSSIADRLDMSVRSVEGHLYRAAQRAGVTSRSELAEILLASTPTSPQSKHHRN